MCSSDLLGQLPTATMFLTLSIFILMSFSLNLHTGYTGMVNFGVIFFVAIGTITVGILTAPENLHGYDWAILPALLIALLLAAAFGWALAYPTARLRTDYFAIVTISLGEIVVVEEKHKINDFENLIDGLYHNGAHDVKIIEKLVDTAIDDDVELNVKDTLTLLGEYIDEVDLQVDKSDLKTLMQSLYKIGRASCRERV